MAWFWKPTPIQNASPATTALRWSTPSCSTIFTPWMNSRPRRTAMYAAATGAGIPIRRAVALGRNATTTKMTPIAAPTLRPRCP